MCKTNLKIRNIFLTLFFLLFTLLPVPSTLAQDTLGQRNTLNIWNAADGSLIRTIETENYIQQARLNSDGTTIVASHDDGIVSSYDVKSGEVIYTRTFDSGTNASYIYTAIKFGFTSNQMFVRQANMFWLWDFVADEILLEGSTQESITEILLSPNGERFLVITQKEQINIFDSASGNLWVAMPPLERIWDIHWSPDSKRIAVAHRAGFNVFDGETGENVLDVPDERGLDYYSRATWSPDGASLSLLALPDENSELYILESETLILRLSIRFDQGVYAVDWNADSRKIVVATYQAEGISTYDVYTGDLIKTYSGDSTADGFLFTGWNYDDTLIVGRGVTQSGEEMYAVWDVATGARVQEFKAQDSLIFPAWDTTKTRILFSVWPSSVVDVIDLTQMDAPRFTLVHEDTIQGAVWSADGQRILTWTGQDRG